jgi:hypothetical protein
MLLVPVVSSDIAAAGYDPSTGELQVQFLTGRIYSYPNVPPEWYQGFIDAPSKGSFFSSLRKMPAQFPPTRLL